VAVAVRAEEEGMGGEPGPWFPARPPSIAAPPGRTGPGSFLYSAWMLPPSMLPARV
jgi:hypothetical protein